MRTLDAAAVPRPVSPRAAALVAAALVVCVAPPARAHDPGLSALDLRVSQDRIIAVLAMAAADARAAVASRSTPGSFADDAIDLELDGVPLLAAVESRETDADAGLRVTLSFPHAGGSRLTVRSAVAARLARGHRQLLTVRTQAGALLHQRMLDAGTTAVELELASRTDEGARARQFLVLGLRHIAAGYDHLLFLGALLLGAGRLRNVVATITAFTVAHSLTLSLAVLGVVGVPGSLVEPLIAASIVFVGVENLVRGQVESRWKVTFLFGLVHGLGFASGLQELGVGTSGRAVAAPLGWFNAGVELGQIAVATIVWPLVDHLNRRPGLRACLAPACSMLVIAGGSYWLLERLPF